MRGDGSSDYKKTVDEMYSLMKEYKSDKKGMLFREFSEEMFHPTLQMRVNQETRWARVDLEAMAVFLRNAPML